MLTYFFIVLGMITLTSLILLLILKRLSVLNVQIFIAVFFSSIIASLLFPGIFNMISHSMGRSFDGFQLAVSFAGTILTYFILVLLLSLTASIILPVTAFAGDKVSGNNRKDSLNNINQTETELTQESSTTNYLEEIYAKMSGDTSETLENPVKMDQQVENNLEKSVDSEKNIDKMGLEAFEHDNFIPQVDMMQNVNHMSIDNAVNLSLDECVEKAFSFKNSSDYEGAILYFMYALDKKPDMELTFMIVVDICSMYKSLGQIEFAKDILSSYFNSYGDEMGVAVRDEIERNLINIYY